MTSRDRLMLRILRGDSDANIQFAGLRQLLLRLGFDERIRGSHHIFRRQSIDERINPPRDDINDALHAAMGSSHTGNVEVKYGGPDGVIIDVSQTGWVGTRGLD